MNRYLLVIVSGAPGAGKTTLARRLGQELRLPVVGKDHIKEAIAEPFPEIDLELSQRLGQAAYSVLYAVAREMLAASSVIVESNFRRGGSEPELRQLLIGVPGCEVNCQLPGDVCVQRYVWRGESGQRHRVHLDRLRAEAVREGLEAGLYGPLQLDIPQVVVDTTDGYSPSLEAITAFVRERLAACRA